MTPNGPSNATKSDLKELIKQRENSIVSSAAVQMQRTAEDALQTFNTELKSRSDTAQAGFTLALNSEIAKAEEASNKLLNKQAVLQEQTQVLLERSQTMLDRGSKALDQIETALTKTTSGITTCDQKAATTIKVVQVLLDRLFAKATQLQEMVAKINSPPMRYLSWAFRLMLIIWLLVISFQLHRLSVHIATINQPKIGTTKISAGEIQTDPADSTEIKLERN